MLQLIVITIVSALINIGLAYYLWRRLVRDTGMRPPWRRIATVAIIVGQLSIPATIWSTRLGADEVAGTLAWPAFLYMALFGLTVVALFAIDLARGLAWIARRVRRAASKGNPRPVDATRREFLAKIGGGAAVVAAGGQVGVGLASVLSGPAVVDVPITLRRLPAGLDGFTIVQITDLHIGLTIDRAYVAEVVRRTNAANPDLIVLTGDLVDGDPAALATHAAPLADLRAPHGVFMVTGNHEYYSGADRWLDVMRGLGITVLRNQRVAIERDGAGFDLAGIDDHSAGQHEAHHGPDLDAALAGRDPSRAVVLLAHQPRQARAAARFDVDLQLSGHTHGGQIWPWHHLVAIQQGGLVAGRYQIGDTQLYVSRGCGYWGPPVRVGAPAELTRVILRTA